MGLAMAPDAAITSDTKQFELTNPVKLTCFALCMAQVDILAMGAVQGAWFRDAAGQLYDFDFVNIWTAGQHVLNGNPAAAYDQTVHKAAQVAALGHDFAGFYPWCYPPTFLIPAALLALAPYISAYLIWVCLTFAAYLAVIRGIIGRNAGILVACACPGVMMNISVGQNGFLSTALIGSALLLMQRQPLVSGLLIGLLSFKPQFGILIPIALMAGGHWKVFLAASLSTLAVNAASLFAFGTAPWEAFFPTIQAISQATLTQGLSDWHKLHSTYALVRLYGGSDTLAWALHGSVMAGSAVAIFGIWRSKVSFEIKAAALGVATVLVTPYIFIYDLIILAVPMAFLLRVGINTGILPGEQTCLALACLLILLYPFVPAPVGISAVFLIVALISRRIFADEFPWSRNPTIARETSASVA